MLPRLVMKHLPQHNPAQRAPRSLICDPRAAQFCSVSCLSRGGWTRRPPRSLPSEAMATLSVSLPVLVLASANLIQFGHIIEHLTGRHPLIYNGYGCYCGLGGCRQPVDATDWCCQVHDCCYQALSRRHCKPKMEKYFYSVRKDTVTCGGETECRRETCECDKAAALCFRHSKFQGQYIGYRNRLCEGPTPPCQGVCPCWAPTKGG